MSSRASAESTAATPTTIGRTESAKELEAKDGNGKEEANAKSAEICRSDIGRTHGSAPTGGPMYAEYDRRVM